MTHLLASALAGGAVFLALFQALHPRAAVPAAPQGRHLLFRRARWERRPRLRPLRG